MYQAGVQREAQRGLSGPTKGGTKRPLGTLRIERETSAQRALPDSKERERNLCAEVSRLLWEEKKEVKRRLRT